MMALSAEQEQQIREQLMTVYDPELGIDIVNLGLIYGIDMDDEGNALITMTLTSPGCPIGPLLEEAIRDQLSQLPFVQNTHVQLVWQPRWDPRIHCSEEAKLELGIWE